MNKSVKNNDSESIKGFMNTISELYSSELDNMPSINEDMQKRIQKELAAMFEEYEKTKSSSDNQ